MDPLRRDLEKEGAVENIIFDGAGDPPESPSLYLRDKVSSDGEADGSGDGEADGSSDGEDDDSGDGGAGGSGGRSLTKSGDVRYEV